MDRPGLRWMLALALVAFLTLVGCSEIKPAEHATLDQSNDQSARTARFTIQVQRLPEGEVVDMTRGELPPLSGALVTIAELGLQGTTDTAGEVKFTLPLGTTPGFGPDEGVYTFDVTVPNWDFHTVVRRRVAIDEPRFAIHYNVSRNVRVDDAVPHRP